MTYSEDLVAVGRERMAVWKERAGQDADRAIAEGISFQNLEDLVPESAEEQDVQAVLVYQLPSGGWHCDILFSGRDGAQGASIGTPEAERLDSKRAAERAGFALLIGILAVVRRRRVGQARPK